MVEPAESLIVPRAWEPLAREHPGGTVMVLGAADSGKTTFVRWLVGRLARRVRTAWLDGDMGQSTLGLPATMNLALADRTPPGLPRPRAAFFVGSTSPAGHMLPVLVGLHRLRERGRLDGAGTTVVDTTGLVSVEGGGSALKQWKIELLGPETVVALQRERELEHILEPLRREGRVRLIELPVSAAVRTTSRKQRAERRKRQFHRYFGAAGEREIPLTDRAVYGLERATEGVLLALQDREGFALAFGVVRRAGEGGLLVRTPFEDLSAVVSLRIGSVRLGTDGC
jgi:polynucleotide 5'-hydroxyl-kinase GRC3/NOL9